MGANVSSDKFIPVYVGAVVGLWMAMMSSYSKILYREAMKKIPLGVPRWLFGLAWLVVYGCEAGILWITTAEGDGSRTALALAWVVVVSLITNALWGRFFFYEGKIRPGAGMVVLDIIFLLALAGAGLALAYGIAVGGTLPWVAFGLSLPYPVWTGLAAWMNYLIYKHPETYLVEGELEFVGKISVGGAPTRGALLGNVPPRRRAMPRTR